jgi:hypothetical protein
VEAGAKEIEVLIEGSGFDQVREVAVIWNGGRAEGVTARVVRSGVTELALALSADGRAKEARGLRIVLTTARDNVEAPVDVEVVAAVPPRLMSLETTTPAPGEERAVLSVRLDAPAGAATAVALSTDRSDLLGLPAEFRVPAGADRADAAVTLLRPLKESVKASVTAELGGDRRGVTVVFEPLPSPALVNLELSASVLDTGEGAQVTVTLDWPAPGGGVPVALTHDGAAVLDAPSQVLVAEGSTRGSASVTAGSPDADVPVTLQAGLGTATRTTTVTVRSLQPRVLSATVDGVPLQAGEIVPVTVTLDRPAPSGGVQVAISTDRPDLLHLLTSVPIEAGGATAVFDVTTETVVLATVEVTAHLPGSAASVDIQIAPPPLEAITTDVGLLQATIADPLAEAAEPPDPVTLDLAGFVAVIVDPAALLPPPEPVTLSVGSFVATIASPPGGGD